MSHYLQGGGQQVKRKAEEQASPETKSLEGNQFSPSLTRQSHDVADSEPSFFDTIDSSSTVGTWVCEVRMELTRVLNPSLQSGGGSNARTFVERALQHVSKISSFF
jgi:hypothetical protein